MAQRCLRARVARFWREDRASVTVEFVVALPILLAMLAFSAQYGNALKIRNNLDVATRDAARYLARAPLDTGGGSVDPQFIDQARTMIEARVISAKASINSFSATSDDTTANVDVSIEVPFPILSFIGLFDTAEVTFAIAASETWVRTGDKIETSGTSGST